MDCLFCHIATKRIDSQVVYEDAQTLAFLDIHPRAPKHTVVIPKVHGATILELAPDVLCALFLTVAKVTGMLTESLKSQGFTIGINHGKVSGQEVPHVHVHIIPRFAGDGGASIQSVVNNPSKN